MFGDQKIHNINRPNELFSKSEEYIPRGLQQYFSMSEDCCSSCSSVSVDDVNSIEMTSTTTPCHNINASKHNNSSSNSNMNICKQKNSKNNICNCNSEKNTNDININKKNSNNNMNALNSNSNSNMSANLSKNISLNRVSKTNCCGGGGVGGVGVGVGVLPTADSKSLHYRKSSSIICGHDPNSRLQDELLNYKRELREYNNTTRELEEKYKKLNIELCEMQKSHDLFLLNHKEANSKNSNMSLSTGINRKVSECLISDINMISRATSREDICFPYQHQHHHHQHHSAVSKDSQTNFESQEKLAAMTQALIDLEAKNRHSSNPTESRKPLSNNHQYSSHNYERFLKNKNKVQHINASQALSNTSLSSQKASLKDFYALIQSVLLSKDKDKDRANDHESEKEKELMSSSSLSSAPLTAPPPSAASLKGNELHYLQSKVANLQHEHAHFKDIIDQQNDCLRDYHSRCLKAQYILKSQQQQIEKLNSSNQQLESEITKGIDDLRSKIDTKLKDISKLPQIMREEQQKYEKICKENQALAERLRSLQDEANQLKSKIEELAKKKAGTLTRLKTAERDLKIFKNYNMSLKQEKRRLCEELQKVKDQLDAIQHSSKRTLSRQREQSEKQRRDLQKRLFELELKISRSKNSTTSLIQERDNLIAELQTQLNTLVHNFEVSQKHIRVLRRHIYSMTGSNPA